MLTKKYNSGFVSLDATQFPPIAQETIDRNICAFEPFAAAVKRLAEYENARKRGLLVRLPCEVGDTVYDVVKCDDDIIRIFKMKVGSIEKFGSMRKNKIWNVYLEDGYTKAYRSFYDFGKTVFLTREDAEQALKEM